MKVMTTSKLTWHPQLPARQPRVVRDWLRYAGSMTRRMEHHCAHLDIQVLYHGRGQATFEEARALDLHQRRVGIVREIIMLGDGVPWLYGRTIVPFDSLRGALAPLNFLDRKPLGKLLFSHPQIQRSPFCYAEWTADWLPLEVQQTSDVHNQALSDGFLKLPARRSSFWLENGQLLLTEVLLPAFLTFIERR
jgi:chorismate lyase